jgi:hypothetical protein
MFFRTGVFLRLILQRNFSNSIGKKSNNVNFNPEFGCGGIILLEINIIIKKESKINNK